MKDLVCPSCGTGQLYWQKEARQEFVVKIDNDKIKLFNVGFIDVDYDKDGVLYCSNNDCYAEASYHDSYCSEEFSNLYDKIYKEGIECN